MRKFEGDFGPSIGRMNMTLAPSKLRERCDWNILGKHWRAAPVCFSHISRAHNSAQDLGQSSPVIRQPSASTIWPMEEDEEEEGKWPMGRRTFFLLF
jgi:hypothetical protein